jgi:hypothetical protein
MATSALSPFFNTQFFTDAGAVAASYKLYTYASGTTTPQTTYTDQAGTVANANPIILDSAGRCTLWLTVAVEYTFVLKTPADVTVKTWDDVGGIPIPSATSFLPLVGGTMTGAIILAANATANLNPVPLQQVLTLVASTSKTASSITVVDAGNYFVGTNVEAALQEIGVGTGKLLRITPFTSSGTWTKGADVRTVIIEAVGGGGGVAAAANGSGGGGSGGYFKKFLSAPAASYTVTIGAGGTSSGTNGSSTTVGGGTATGGLAPIAGATLAAGGAGGSATGGDINMPGNGGGWGGNVAGPDKYFGHGGGTRFGGGPPGTINNAGGTAATANTGAGAAGGTGGGAAGGSGYAVFYEYG